MSESTKVIITTCSSMYAFSAVRSHWLLLACVACIAVYIAVRAVLEMTFRGSE